ncbi:MAG: biosynthetic arginine decarboxylase [Gammaproteobacteria bacterium]
MWSIDQSKEHYNLPEWGEGYFDIADDGELIARVSKDPKCAPIVISELVRQLMDEGLRLPILVRFTDILKDRIHKLISVFGEAKKTFNYEGLFQPVYPIKVNQQYHVVETLFGADQQVGLEAGSKSELLAVLSIAEKKPQTTIICNGYKDAEYIQLALIGKQLGHNVYIIIEKLSELDIVIREMQNMQIEPLLGFRVRLASIASGNWQNTGGKKSKFGLTAQQVQTAIAHLEKENILHTVKLLHCHLGSQVANIRDIQKGINECARFYAALCHEKAAIEIVNVGGGLGVDYEGTHSRNACSINYSWQEYANTIVSTLKSVCDENELNHPTIISESGRGMTAHHAVLITNVIDSESASAIVPEVSFEENSVLTHLRDTYNRLTKRNATEMLHEASYWLESAYHAFEAGAINIESRAIAEQIYFSILIKVQSHLNHNAQHYEILNDIHQQLATKLFCNLSIFQSLPDIWAINQLFPILPMSQLHVAPTMHAILQDITCDSDGRIDQYISDQGVENTLRLPPYKDQGYWLGFFMVGAYQEVLGDIHNLFGDTDSVHVEYDASGELHVTHKLHGDNSATLLNNVHFQPQKMLASYQRQCERSGLDEETSREFMQAFLQGLDGYTYLE